MSSQTEQRERSVPMIRPPRLSPSGPRPGRLLLAQVLLLAVVLGSWEIVSRAMDAEIWIGSPSGVADQLASWARSGVIWESTWTTLSEALIGFVVGASLGAATGFLFGWYLVVGRVIEPFVIALYTMPRIAIAPLFVLWLGIGMVSKAMMAATMVYFFVFFTTFQGTKAVDRDLVDISLVMGGSRRVALWKIGVPNAAIWVFSGLRMALPYSLMGAVVGEFIASQVGLGYLIKNASTVLNTDGVFAGLFVLMVIANVLYLGLVKVEARVLRWRT